MLIYIITNDVNKKVYIGQTTKTLEERIVNHRNSMVSGVDTHIYRAMRKYGWEKFHFAVIATAEDQSTLDELEAYFIKKYDAIRNGYNMVDGGHANPMYSDVVLEKHNAVMRSEDVRRKISESMKESYKARGGPTAEHRQHLSDARKALYASPEGQAVKEKFRKSFKLSPEHYAALNNAKNKAVYCIDEQGQTVAEFSRVKDAAIWWRSHGWNASDLTTLQDAIKRSSVKDKYVHGLKWIYRV